MLGSHKHKNNHPAHALSFMTILRIRWQSAVCPSGSCCSSYVHTHMNMNIPIAHTHRQSHIICVCFYKRVVFRAYSTKVIARHCHPTHPK